MDTPLQGVSLSVSTTFQDFNRKLIKDLRTNFETGNTKAVLDGDLDDFIAASLKQGV